MVQNLEESWTGRTFADNVLSWWKGHKRNYPWRKTENPYRILISEVLLHRTRADQVAHIYARFLELYPTLSDLAAAEPDEVSRTLRPLGLSWRARLLPEMARMINERFDGKIPEDLESLKALPGVSDYIAAAVQSFAFEISTPILDTNTVRIVGRVFGIPVSDSSRRSEKFRDLYNSLMDPAESRDFNMAMIDLAALLCRPLNPKCHLCPVYSNCNYGRSQKK